MSQVLERYDFTQNDNGVFVPLNRGNIDVIPVFSPTEDLVRIKEEELVRNYHLENLPDGRPIGISWVNGDYLDDAVATVTTQNSKLKQNESHFFEIASAGASNPRKGFITIDSPTRLTKKEAQVLRQTGRFTYYDEAEHKFRALPTFEAINKILQRIGLEPLYISGNHAGYHFAQAISLGFPDGSVKVAYANGLQDISDENDDAYLSSNSVEDSIGWAKLHFGADKWTPTKQRRKEVKALAPEIYQDQFHTIKMFGLWVVSAANDALVYRKAFRGHGNLDKPEEHAALNDAEAFLRTHEEATLNLQFNRGDKSQSPDQAIRFGELLVNMIGEPRVRVLIGEGKRDDHTAHPMNRWQAERWALSH